MNSQNPSSAMQSLLNSQLMSGLLIIDQQDQIVESNHQALTLLRIPEDSLPNSSNHPKLSLLQIIKQLPPSAQHPTFGPELINQLLQAVRKSGQEQTQAISLQQAQQEQWLLFSAQPLDYPAGSIGLVLQDITKQHQQDIQKTRQLAEIADQNRQWQAIFNGVQESIVRLDPRGYVITINPATEKITGRRSSEVIGHPIGKLFPKVDQSAPGLDQQGRSGLKQVLQDQRPSDLFEAIIETKDKRHIWINYTYTPLKDPKGQLIGFIRVTSDVSTVKAVDQMKNDFISIASHELRTPLGVINSYLTLFLNNQLGSLTPDQRIYIQRLQRSGQDMSDLVEDLLNMSRLEGGRIELTRQPLSIKELISEIITHLEPRYQAKNIQIDLQTPDKPFTIEADKKKLEQALINLIDNAIKYTYDNGRIAINVSQQKNRALISVADSGVGIRPESLTHIFEKFYREGNPLSIKEGGSGLGLYISQKLVELHGGRISASSTHQKGSVFTVELPFIDQPAPSEGGDSQ